MTDEKDTNVYPVKSLHDFLYELDREWSKFRNGIVISLITSGILLVFVILDLLQARRLGLGPIEFVALIIVGILLGYSFYAMYSQFRFFSRWERRVGLLLHMEDELAKKLDDKPAEKPVEKAS
jgi:hypothetical protein